MRNGLRQAEREKDRMESGRRHMFRAHAGALPCPEAKERPWSRKRRTIRRVRRRGGLHARAHAVQKRRRGSRRALSRTARSAESALFCRKRRAGGKAWGKPRLLLPGRGKGKLPQRKMREVPAGRRGALFLLPPLPAGERPRGKRLREMPEMRKAVLRPCSEDLWR